MIGGLADRLASSGSTFPAVTTPDAADHGHGGHPGRPVALAMGALGIVYGDIGTSPIYAFRESFEHVDLTVDTTNAYGVASVVFWALVVIISIKYLALVMRADNHGEGGILALTALLLPNKGLPQGRKRIVIALGVFGTALLYGDGLITPAISVLSAVEGFEVATSANTPPPRPRRRDSSRKGCIASEPIYGFTVTHDAP